jgi:hypothetical protein
MSPGFSVILRQGPDMVFAVWSGTHWSLFRLDTDNPRLWESKQTFRSFTDAARAHIDWVEHA